MHRITSQKHSKRLDSTVHSRVAHSTSTMNRWHAHLYNMRRHAWNKSRNFCESHLSSSILTTTRLTPVFLCLAFWQQSQNDVSGAQCDHGFLVLTVCCVLCFVLATSEVWGPTSQYLSFPVALWVIMLKRTFYDLLNNSTWFYKIRLRIGIYAPRCMMQPRKQFQYLLDCFVLTN